MEFDYKIRCDKHQFKPYEYCEMCWMRSYIQEEVENIRKDARSILGNTHLAIQVLNDCFFKLEKRINELERQQSQSPSERQ
jgi:hypothetical protein